MINPYCERRTLHLVAYYTRKEKKERDHIRKSFYQRRRIMAIALLDRVSGGTNIRAFSVATFMWAAQLTVRDKYSNPLTQAEITAHLTGRA